MQVSQPKEGAEKANTPDELLPCPFCGQAPTEYDQIGYSSVKCHTCKFSLKVKSEDGPPYALDLWNCRTTSSAQTEQQASAAQQILNLIMEECSYWHERDEARRGNFATLYAAAKELVDNTAPVAQIPAQVTAAMWKAAYDSMESDGDLALALQEALNAAPQCRHRFMYFGDQKKRRCADCCVVEGNEQAATQPEQSELAEVLRDAERFIAGFEGCELQEGIDELLLRIRAAQSVLGGSNA